MSGSCEVGSGRWMTEAVYRCAAVFDGGKDREVKDREVKEGGRKCLLEVPFVISPCSSCAIPLRGG